MTNSKIYGTAVKFLTLLGGLTFVSTHAAEDVKLLLPEKFYAVQGYELSIYYDNIVTVINPANYVFVIDSPIGRTDAKRWRFVPGKEHHGEYPFTVKVVGSDGKIRAQGESKIFVASASSGKGENLSILIIGASQSASKTGYPKRLYARMQGPENPVLTMIGSNGPDYQITDNVRHEAYGGWGWHSFFLRYGQDESAQNDGLHPRRPWQTNSRFVFAKNGKYEFDFQMYCNKYNSGKAPDVVLIMLGVNNIFLAHNNAEVKEKIKKDVTPWMKRWVSEIRKFSPQTHIVFSTLIPGAASQDAFGANYQNQQTRWGWRNNLDFYHRYLFQYVKVLKVGILPLYASVDGENGFRTMIEPAFDGAETMISRQSNAIHPAISGQNQIGDIVYFYLKALLMDKSFRCIL